MKDLTELVEALLVYAAAYPVTLWNLVFAPSSVFTPTVPERVCPPSIAFLFTVAIIYYRFRILSIKFTKSKEFELFTTELVVVCATIYIAVITNIQQFVISFVGVASTPFVEHLHVLLYPASIIFILMLPLTEVISRFSGWWSFGIVVAHAAYFVSLRNVCRFAFGFAKRDALIAATYAYGALLCIVVIVTAALTIYEKRAVSRARNRSESRVGPTSDS
jgi:hypothetical protein